MRGYGPLLVALGLWTTRAAAADEQQPGDWGGVSAEEETEPIKPPAEPEVEPRSFSDRPGHVMLQVGAGTLVGLLGVTVGYSVHDRLELGAGFGTNGLGSMGGPYVRVRPAVTTRGRNRTLHAFAIDLGLSVGKLSYQQNVGAGALGHTRTDEWPHYHSDLALFLQTEFSWEMVKLGGFSMRGGGGLATLLNRGSIECDPSLADTAAAGCGNPPSFFPVLLFALGTAF